MATQCTRRSVSRPRCADPAAPHHNNPVTAYSGRTLTGVVHQTWLHGITLDLGAPPRAALDDVAHRAVLPRGTMRDIVTSALPFWEQTRAWVVARPLSGFAETFSQYIVEVLPGGGSSHPEPDAGAEAVLFVVRGTVRLVVAGQTYEMWPGGYAYLPPGTHWKLHNEAGAPATFHWIRKAYEPVTGIDPPEAFVTSDADHDGVPMPGPTAPGRQSASSTPLTYGATWR